MKKTAIVWVGLLAVLSTFLGSEITCAQQKQADVANTTEVRQKQVDEEKQARMEALQREIEECKRQEYEMRQAEIAALKEAEHQFTDRLKAQKKDLEAERQTLQGDRSRTIALFENLLRKYKHEEIDVADLQLIHDARFKLGQLYYEQTEETYRAAMDRFMTEAERYSQGLIPFLPEEPKRDLGRSIAMYREIAESSDDPGTVAYSLYSIGWSYSKQGESEKALQSFQELVERFPNDSVNAPDAYRMIGDYYFERPDLAGNEDFKSAIAAYKNILPFWQSPRYPEALYLLGWCAFNNKQHYEAIGYFTLVVDEIDWFDIQEISNRELINPDLRKESLEYIALSFWEMGLEALNREGGENATVEVVEKAASYAKSKAGKPYAPEILEELGQIYLEAGGQDPRFVRDSSRAYRRLLEIFPDYVRAPRIHRQLADNFHRLGERDQGYQAYEDLFARYNRTGPWAKAKAAELSPEQIQEADSLAAYCLLEAAKYTYTQGGGDLIRVREAANKFKRYLDYYAQSKEAYEINMKLATIYDQELQNYDAAWEEYLRVSREYDQDTYRQVAAYQAVVVAQKMLQ